MKNMETAADRAYRTLATSRTPALIVYLLDLSASMNQPLGGSTRSAVAADALHAAVRRMVFRSTKGSLVAPRYRIAIYGYSDEVYDLLGGIQTIDSVAHHGIPELPIMNGTDAALGFAAVHTLLARALPNMQNCPAPLVCHMTDGNYTGSDPLPIAQEIRTLRTSDGEVLIENIFIDGGAARVADARGWGGITGETPLRGYAARLREMSSPLPESYHSAIREAGYSLSNDARMFFPGATTELIELGFVTSAATPIR